MKVSSLLLILSVTLAFFSGRIAFLVSDQRQITNQEVRFIHTLTQELQERVNIHYDINLLSLYKKQSYLELLNPSTLYRNQISWTTYENSCMQVILQQKGQSTLSKTDIWDSYRCQIISILPENFFSSSPFLHESGRSFAFLMYQHANRSLSLAWLKKHLPYFHIDELKDLPIELPAAYRFMQSLSEMERMQLTNGRKFFMTSRYLVINNGLLNFAVYPLRVAIHFFKRSGYQISAYDPNRSCYYLLDQVCVRKSKLTLPQRLTETTYLVFGAAIIILLITVSGLYNRIHKQNLEEERKKHALRVLTHELRTPISSLLLQMENLHQDAEKLDASILEKLLRLESDIYRLKHLAEKSRGYLQSDSDQFIQFQPILIDSLNEFIHNIIEKVQTAFPQANIEFNSKADISCKLDPYWVQMCLSNLLENSIRYGVAPTRISTFITDKTIEIEVSDQGSIEHTNIKSLLKSNPKSTNTQGMGIGLKIVYKTLKEMGGNLELTAAPTTFMMEIPFRK